MIWSTLVELIVIWYFYRLEKEKLRISFYLSMGYNRA